MKKLRPTGRFYFQYERIYIDKVCFLWLLLQRLCLLRYKPDEKTFIPLLCAPILSFLCKQKLIILRTSSSYFSRAQMYFNFSSYFPVFRELISRISRSLVHWQFFCCHPQACYLYRLDTGSL